MMENLEQSQPAVEKSTAESMVAIPETKPQRQLLYIILLCFLMFVLGGAVVFAYFTFLKPEKVVSQPVASPTVVPSPTPSPSSISTPTPIIPADWQTLENANGYKISYPETLEVFSDTGMQLYEPSEAPGIRITQKGGGYYKPGNFYRPWLGIYAFNPGETKYKAKSLKELAEANFNDNIGDKATFIRAVEDLHQSEFRGETSYEYAIESKGFFGAWTGFLGEQGVYRIIIFEHNDRLFLIGYYDNPEFRQILSTFKFTE